MLQQYLERQRGFKNYYKNKESNSDEISRNNNVNNAIPRDIYNFKIGLKITILSKSRVKIPPDFSGFHSAQFG